MTIKKCASIGVDIGGTKVASILWDGKKAVAEITEPTKKQNLKEFWVLLEKQIEFLLKKAKQKKLSVDFVGLGVPGVIDISKNLPLKMPNIPILDRVDIGGMIKKKYGLTAKVDNDTNCFTRAEVMAGAAKGHKNVFGVIVGTGIGGSWWHDGKIYIGTHGSSGEVGCTVVDFNSGLHLENAYHLMMYYDPRHIAAAARKGLDQAENIFKSQGRFLGMSFANVVNIIDPELIVFGGSLVKSADLFFPEMQKTMRMHIESPIAAKKVKVVAGKLGPLAGAIGAALLV